jgi:hypothetical protein
MVFPKVLPTSSLTSHASVSSHEAGRPTVDGALAKEDATKNHNPRCRGGKKIKKKREKTKKKMIFTEFITHNILLRLRGSEAEKSEKLGGLRPI